MERVELCCHTGMSDDNSVASPKALIQRAIDLGMKAIAITDLDSVQALPEAFYTVKYLNEERAHEREDAGLPDEEPLKVIYGAELRVEADEEFPEDLAEHAMEIEHYRVLILAKTDEGLRNLYKLITLSHRDYRFKYLSTGIIPRSILEDHRDGLLIGSSAYNGEMFEALLRKESDETLKSIALSYDFLAIEPISNMDYLFNPNLDYHVSCRDEIEDYHRKLINLGEKLDIPVIATSSVKYPAPEDEIALRILSHSKGWETYDMYRTGNYLRSTEEMLTEFDYLGEDCATRIVVENTIEIFCRIGDISPVKKVKHYPSYPDAESRLREACEKRVHELYGESLPKDAEVRIDKELSQIIDNGFASLYMYAGLLVDKSRDDGYPTFLRGLGGGSFVAYLAGITDVNPLKSHYLCPHCLYSDFETDDLEGMYPGAIGTDLPDKTCPVCGEILHKEGFNIPAETFLGFMGDKEPDFDISFATEYRDTVIEYLEHLPGIAEIYSAGSPAKTISYNAGDLISAYCDAHDISLSETEHQRAFELLFKVKEGNDINHGGVIVVPDGIDIFDYTPLQPDQDKRLASHIEYYSFDSCLLKMDILTHRNLDMIHMIEQETGVMQNDIPLEDEKMMSLFYSTDAFEFSRGEIKNGLAGVFYFTDIPMKLIESVKPYGISDIMRIEGLRHGEGVLDGNVYEIIDSNVASCRECISTRDDVMHFLLSKGMDRKDAFTIMEWVRKGRANTQSNRGFKPEMEQNMLDHGVPEWYIDSCHKIRYLFPRAHTVEYTLLAWRLLYYKLYNPEAFYKAYIRFFSELNGSALLHGEKHASDLFEYYAKLEKSGRLSEDQKGILLDSRVAVEMYARGIVPDKSWKER